MRFLWTLKTKSIVEFFITNTKSFSNWTNGTKLSQWTVSYWSIQFVLSSRYWGKDWLLMRLIDLDTIPEEIDPVNNYVYWSWYLLSSCSSHLLLENIKNEEVKRLDFEKWLWQIYEGYFKPIKKGREVFLENVSISEFKQIEHQLCSLD